MYLRLELTTKEEIADWERVKKALGIKANTEALRALIRQKALECSRVGNTKPAGVTA